jgi:hypothetical protein
MTASWEKFIAHCLGALSHDRTLLFSLPESRDPWQRCRNRWAGSFPRQSSFSPLIPSLFKVHLLLIPGLIVKAENLYATTPDR